MFSAFGSGSAAIVSFACAQILFAWPAQSSALVTIRALWLSFRAEDLPPPPITPRPASAPIRPPIAVIRAATPAIVPETPLKNGFFSASAINRDRKRLKQATAGEADHPVERVEERVA